MAIVVKMAIMAMSLLMVKVLFIVFEIVIAAFVFIRDIIISITGIMNFNGAVIEKLMAICGTRMANFEFMMAIIETKMATIETIIVIMKTKMPIIETIKAIIKTIIAVMISLFQ
jgi:hypothetical protein